MKRWSAFGAVLAPVCLVAMVSACDDESDDGETADIPLPSETASAAASTSGFALESAAPVASATAPSASASASASASVKKPSGPAFSITKCCAALHNNAKSAPAEQQATYAMAAGACDNMKNDPNSLAQIRRMTMAVGVPNACG
ncbi:MAG: hypothetical protein HOW73_18745 [Polyangiaceae bacterium]|nr:hypothetical protein [Polyangiaceae bacterium]